MKLNPHRTGLALGAFGALVHIVWVGAVAVGFAQTWLDFVLSMHFLSNPYRISAFNGGQAVMLVVIAGVLGYVFGNVFSVVWNKVQK